MMILYADDDVDDREILFDVVNRIDPAIRCEFATNGLEAMNFLAETQQMPDYIFLDINMPLMNGKTCLTILKSHSTLKTIPVIMYSTTILQEEVRELYSLGAMSVIQKPNDIVQLYSTMSELFTQISCVR
jgi:CheY-like chemotaxis protein